MRRKKGQCKDSPLGFALRQNIKGKDVKFLPLNVIQKRNLHEWTSIQRTKEVLDDGQGQTKTIELFLNI